MNTRIALLLRSLIASSRRTWICCLIFAPILFGVSITPALANPVFTGSDCLNYIPLTAQGVCVSGNGPDGTSYFNIQTFGSISVSGSATSSGATSNLATLTQSASVSSGVYGAFTETADAKYWDTFTSFPGAAPGAMGTLTLTTTFSSTLFGSGSATLSAGNGSKVFTAMWNAPFPGWQNPISVTFPLTAPIEFSVDIYAAAPSSSSAGVIDPLMLSLPAGVSYTTASGLQEFNPSGPPPPPVPEPGSVVLLATGLVGVCLCALRRTRQKTPTSAARYVPRQG